MTISFLPAGTKRFASSRVRVYCLLGALRRRGVTAVLGYEPGADVLFVQKRITRDVIQAATHFRDPAKLVVYDCDDLGSALERWAPAELLAEFIRSTDVVTTNSVGFRDGLRARVGDRPIEIIPDAVDYFLEKPAAPEATEGEPLRLLWFGYRHNLRLFEECAAAIRKIPRCRLLVCTNPRFPWLAPTGSRLAYLPWNRRSLARFPRWFTNFESWELDTFPKVLRSCHLAVLSHLGSAEDRAKSSNRLVTSVAWGTPVVASRTPAYEEAAVAMGCPECLFNGPDDLPNRIESLRSAETRQRYLETAQPRIWRTHSPDAVAESLCRALERYLSSRR